MSVDLESLARGYAHRPASSAALHRAARAARSVDLGPGALGVDVGGGRGEHAAVWVDRGARAVVVDSAAGMVRAAAQRDVVAIRATAQALPFRDSCARLAYFHLSLHYGDWRRSLREAARVLVSGGECWIWTMGRKHHRTSFLAGWFPSVATIDSERFPDPGAVAADLTTLAQDVETGVEIESKQLTAGAWRTGVSARFVSTLQLISEDELTAGLVAFDAAHPDPDELLQYELRFDWIRARF
jgi:SAM-dependent methyltransferase